MTNNLKQFLEADALRTQGEWRPTALAGVVALGGHVADVSLSFNADNNALFIAAASRIAPDIRAMQDAFERVCEALEELSAEEWRDDDDPILDVARIKARKALTAAAPYRKGGV